MVENQQTPAIALTWVLPSITAVLVVLRLYSRYLGRSFGWDDGLTVVAWVLIILESVSTYEMTISGHYGYHIWDVPQQSVEQKVNTLKWSYTLQLIYHLLMGAIRASVVLFLFRLGDKRRHIQAALHTVFWLNVGYTISTFTANVFLCSPVRYSYEKPAMDRMVDGQLVPGGRCSDLLVFTLASCGLSIFMDLVIIPIPMAMVWNLQMPRKTKAAVVAVISLGWVATVISGVRFAVYYHRWQPGYKDRNYNIGFVVSIAESNVAMWAACAPALGRLIRHSRWLGSGWSADARTMRDQANAQQHPNDMCSGSSKSKSDDGLYDMRGPAPDSDGEECIFVAPRPTRSRSAMIGGSDEESDWDLGSKSRISLH